MDIAHLWRAAQPLPCWKSPLGWMPKPNSDCAVIISSDFHDEAKGSYIMRHIFWHYIEHTNNTPLTHYRHQLGYVWFEQGEREALEILTAPSGWKQAMSDYDTHIKHRLEAIAGYLRAEHGKVGAWVKEGDSYRTITLGNCTPLGTPEEIIFPYDNLEATLTLLQ